MGLPIHKFPFIEEFFVNKSIFLRRRALAP